ncbi:hypothetical protein [Bartonella schoenbuchensis]|uniref:Uncharacterized protein n=1 Tax=Bartonella schoenbuchensis (strain DSM 13525 / NCTC 13165 / R1) TaxID=687861 RepID=E6YZS3_BARSR|nr:hypothetical protein [Bartonella schoenbuchensis]AQX30829.1 hypothetical protein BscR1v2_008970 [Bartonella schoenbuchensis R1]CBI82361.1 conserved hypothetical protein [Bartonella schoenbuchensis R1]
MHLRDTLRETFVELIKASKTSAGDEVYNMRDFNFFNEEHPFVNVSTPNETIEDGHDYGARRRVLTVDVECYDTRENGARFVDQLAWEIEAIFHSNPSLNNTVESCRLQNIAMAFGDNGSLALHGSILTFEVTYVTNISSEEDDAVFFEALKGMIKK